MNKLNKTLASEMNLNPEKTFRVIITLKDGVKPESLAIPNYKTLMDTMLTAGLTVSQLQGLAKNEGIEAIELDAEMGIL